MNLDIAGGSTADTTTLSIGGNGVPTDLPTDSLVFSGPGDDASIDVESGGILEIFTTLDATHTETTEPFDATITLDGGQVNLGSANVNSPNVAFSFNSTEDGILGFLAFSAGETADQVIINTTFNDSIAFFGADFSDDTFDYSGTTLKVMSGATTVLTIPHLSGSSSAPLGSENFEGFGAFINIIVCFAAGTQIRTPDGERPVESLVQGDIVLTLADGQLIPQPVKWIGRRPIDLTKYSQPEKVAPVRIQHGAFADNVPHSDLLLSPDHAIFVDGKLICARQLINGTTIRPEKDLRSIEYFHIELDAHAILLAAGLPVESYLNTGNQGLPIPTSRSNGAQDPASRVG